MVSKPTPFYLPTQLDGHGITCQSGGMQPPQTVIASGLVAGLFEALVPWRPAG